MTQSHQDGGDLVHIVAPLVGAIPQLWRVIEQQAGAVTFFQARVAVLEEELLKERERAIRAEDEAEKWYHETLRLESRLP